MKVIKAGYEILTKLDREEILKSIEIAGRTCYKSEDRITEDSASKFVEMVCKRQHLSVIEHKSMTVRFIVDRGVSHELVRHRISSFSQESTRYVNYKGEMEFIEPSFWGEIGEMSQGAWLVSMEDSERRYRNMIKFGCKPEQARSVLPNSLKTEIVMTANFRQWKEVFKQRCSPEAHPQMREVMLPLRKEMQKILPEIFGV